MAVDSAVRACCRWPVLAYSVPRPQVAVGLQRAHAQFLSQGQGLLVVGFCLFDIGGVGVGLDHAKLSQGVRLVPASLCAGPGRGLAGVLPGLLTLSRQTTDLPQPCDPEGPMSQCARAETFADRLLQQRAPLREAPLERSGIAQPATITGNKSGLPEARQRARPCLQHPDGGLQVPLGGVQLTEPAVGNDRCGPSAC